MSEVEAWLARVNVVLMGPKRPENIGAAARVAANMGMGGLMVIGPPLTDIDLETAAKTATHHARQRLLAARYYLRLEEAVAGCALVIGTTARRGRQRLAAADPAQLAALVAPALESGPVALLFGPEDKGLSTRDLSGCAQVVSIPTAPGFSSLNLAQAVAVIGYALRQGMLHRQGLAGDGLYRPRPASPPELAGMFQAAASALKALDATAEREEGPARLLHLRRLAGRAGISAREARLFAETCQQVARLALGG